MRSHIVPDATLLVFLCLFSFAIAFPSVQASPGWAWSILYQFDKGKYAPGSRGVVSFSLTNKGDVRLQVTQVGIQFDWLPSDRWWSQSINVVLNPGQQVSLGTVTFDVPSGTKEGVHKFRAGVVQSHEERRFNPYTGVWYWYWVDDSVQYMDGYDEILIEELKAVLTIVSVSGLPVLNRPIFISETSTIVVVVSNSGNAKAQAVKVLLEDLSSAASLIVTSSDGPKDLDPGKIDQWKIDVLGQKPGTYTGRLRVYAGNQRMLEQPWKLEVAAPEIRIVRKELSQEGQIYLGDVFTVTYRLRNTSPVDARSLTFNINMGTGLTIIESPTITEIGSQSEVTAILKMRADRTGTAEVQVAITAYEVAVLEDKFTLSISERPIWLQSWFLPVVAVSAALVIVGLVMYRRRAPKAPSLVVGESRLPSKPSATCPRCGGSLTFVQARSKYYCTRCKEYV